MIIENIPVSSSTSNGIVERAIRSVQRVIRTIRNAIEEKLEVSIDVTHSVWTVDRQTSIISLNKVRRSKRQNGVRAAQRKTSKGAMHVDCAGESCGKGTERKSGCKVDEHVEDGAKPTARKVIMERSSGRQREKYGNEATWR